MYAPHIASTTVGLGLPGWTVTKDNAETHITRTAGGLWREAGPRRQLRKSRVTPSYITVLLPLLLIVVNIGMFGLYLYHINYGQGLTYNLQQAQKELHQAQDRQRQLQVVMAEQTANIRAQGQTPTSGNFVAVGTPEFISAKPNALTMR